jgi:hypothetical protein
VSDRQEAEREKEGVEASLGRPNATLLSKKNLETGRFFAEGCSETNHLSRQSFARNEKRRPLGRLSNA